MTHDPKTLYRFLTPGVMRDVLQEAGYRVAESQSPDGAPVLASATGGLGFEVRFFNPLTAARKGAAAGTAADDKSPAYADAAFRAAFRVEGELPLGLVNAWNASHRFARLNLMSGWLLFDMDVVALGGVLADNLRAQAEIWDRLVQELIAYLRAELPKLAKPAPVAEPVVREVEPAPALDAALPSPLPAA